LIGMNLRPLIVAVVGFAAECVNAGLVHGTALLVVTAVIGVATSLGVHVAAKHT